jgi:hypothetical protein
MNRQLMAALAAVTVTAAACNVPAAHADPAPPVPPGYVACGDQLIPADPRIDVQNPLGAAIYRAMLQAMCPPPGGAHVTAPSIRTEPPRRQP